ASTFVKYHDLLDVHYQWDVTTGILVCKEVTAPSGLQLIVVQGKGNIFPAWESPLVLLVLVILVGWFRSVKKRAELR
ncbi:MAG: hypothetical protein ACFFAU_19695, partial [Candidatus Hodarchaeota archaeon]